MSDCRKRKIAVPELGQKMAVSDCRKNKMAVPEKKQKMRFVDNRKRHSFSVFFFSVFLFPVFFFISYSLFLGERRQKEWMRKKRVFPPSPPVSLYKK